MYNFSMCSWATEHSFWTRKNIWFVSVESSYKLTPSIYTKHTVTVTWELGGTYAAHSFPWRTLIHVWYRVYIFDELHYITNTTNVTYCINAQLGSPCSSDKPQDIKTKTIWKLLFLGNTIALNSFHRVKLTGIFEYGDLANLMYDRSTSFRAWTQIDSYLKLQKHCLKRSFEGNLSTVSSIVVIT